MRQTVPEFDFGLIIDDINDEPLGDRRLVAVTILIPEKEARGLHWKAKVPLFGWQ
jgi:hypothetical protein